MSEAPHPLDIPACLLLTAEKRREGWKRQPPKPMPASIEAEGRKESRRAGELAAWKQDNPELVEAQKQLAKIKRRKKRNGKSRHRSPLLARH